MNLPIRVLYIERDPRESVPIIGKLSEKGTDIILETVSSVEAALVRLPDKPPIHLLLLESSASDPEGKGLPDRAEILGIPLPPALLLQSDESAGLDLPATEDIPPDRILKRDGYLFELPYRIRSAYAQARLRSQLAEQKRIEESLHVHQIELEMQNEELKRIQLALDKSRARYFDLYDLAPVGYCSVGQSGLILEANLTLTSLLGIPRSALLNRPFVRFVFEEDADLFNRMARNPDLNGYSRKLELRMLKADGTPTWMLLDVSQGHWDEGASSFRIILSDISHLKRAEEALRESEAFNLAILDSMAPEIAVLNREGAIVRVNESWRRFAPGNGHTGASRGRGLGIGIPFWASGRFAADMMSEKEALEARIGIQAVLDGRLPAFNLEYPCEGPGGRQWFILNATPLGHGSSGVVLSHTDITAHKLQEDRLREAQKMLAIGTLAGGIAHDFNNLLTIILGNAELARQSAGPAANTELLQCLADIQNAGTRAVYTVKQILAFSRSQPTERRPLALGPIVEETVRLLKVTLPGRFKLDLWCDPAAPEVLADATQVQQAILNVVTNAMQAIKDGPGHIGVRLEPARLDAGLVEGHPELRALYERGKRHAARITITDNGSGMDAATMARIFDPFFTTKSVNEGTGLGLSVVHGIVRNHEGAILVESAPGGGSTFRIYFPEAQWDAQSGPREEPEAEAAGSKPPEPSGQGRILFLDDERTIVSLFRIKLEQRGYRFFGFTNPEAAIQAVREAPGAFDLVVSDYNMPGMSGVDVAREIRKIREDLPVALASGYLDAAVLAAGGQAGIKDFFFKVTAVEEICALMARLQETQSYIPLPSE